MPDAIRKLLATDVALAKLHARGISQAEAEQLLGNRHAVVRNLRGAADRPQQETRRLLIGRTDGGSALTLVIEETIDPTDWLLITGWRSTLAERRLVGRRTSRIRYPR